MPDLSFRFSLSVLNHLGRGLYRSLATVIAEAISNAWDADASEVRVELKGKSLVIWDNGIGMDDNDIRNKFLKIGYSKRDDMTTTGKNRSVHGRKGIGKLAYLSISDDIIVRTRKKGSKQEIAIKLSNEEIDACINQNANAEEHDYPVKRLKSVDDKRIQPSGTILVFDGLRSRLVKKNLRQTLATHFHFTSATGFSIYVNDKIIDISDMKNLYKKIQFIWFVSRESEKDFNATAKEAGISTANIKRSSLLDKKFTKAFNAHGFIASVEKPSDLVIKGSHKEFKASIALFAGGRMRQAELLSDMSTAQYAESYMFGQIHVDRMDEGADRFASSRDSVKETDPYYAKFIKALRKVSKKVGADWDSYRRKLKEDGDPSNMSISPDERKYEEIINLWVKTHELTDFENPADQKVVDRLTAIVRENFGSYLGCFIAENLARSLIYNRSISLTPKMKKEIARFKRSEKRLKVKANIAFDITPFIFGKSGVDYMDLTNMAAAIDKWAKTSGNPNSLMADADSQAPIRNALMHTRHLTPKANNQGEIAWVNLAKKIFALINEQNGKKE